MIIKKKPKAKAKPDGKPGYDVGYKKPPEHTRFKPGKSGNSKGRPKGAKNLKTELEEELLEKIKITESGKPKNISKQRAMIKALMAKAVQGDVKSAMALLNMFLKLVPDQANDRAEDDWTDTDQQILDDFAASVLQSAAKGGESK